MPKRMTLTDYIPAALPPRGPTRLPPRPRGRPRVAKPICAREGCGKEVRTSANVFCSNTCRNVALAPVRRQRAEQRAQRKRELDEFATTPELREGFRLALARVPVREWDEEVRRQYNAYHRMRRNIREAEKGDQHPEWSAEVKEAFALVGRRVRAEEWPENIRRAYSEHLLKKRAERQADAAPRAGTQSSLAAMLAGLHHNGVTTVT